MYQIEFDPELEIKICDNGQKFSSATGFVYKNNDAHAIYYLRWHPESDENFIHVGIAIGEWDDTEDKSDRCFFGGIIWFDNNKEEFLFSFVDPTESPWPSTELCGDMLLKSLARGHCYEKEVYRIIEEITYEHKSAREFLLNSVTLGS